MASLQIPHSKQPTAARLLSSVVLVLACAGWMLGGAKSAQAGCDFGHGRHNDNVLNDSQAYARHFRVLGKWVYEAGQTKYVKWQSEDRECDGPNCSGKKEPKSPLSGLSQSRENRTSSTPVYFQQSVWSIIPEVLHLTALEQHKAVQGYPTAYEYPP